MSHRVTQSHTESYRVTQSHRESYRPIQSKIELSVSEYVCEFLIRRVAHATKNVGL